MARSNAVWAIDVGQCALKALRCRLHENGKQLVAEGFDYIEYPKILSQPDTNPNELVGEALDQFLSRNSVRGERVVISVPGQAGLARFIKLPPVEVKKIPDIVRFEARQQIPFDLNDVIWDYQRLGGAEEEGFALETEIGLFAMKRDAVFRALEPFRARGIEVEIVQLTPLALYNFVLFDRLTNLPPPDEYDPENPPESVVLISMGTDATDLVVTNGYRVWQRSVPLGGNHFTRALTKGLKLTFAKAEHLKRNAAAAQDPKAVFQAMRPVFHDLLTELQRSISYFTTLDRAAKIGRMLVLGSATKLPGLRRYLSQSLGFDIERVEHFHNLVGPQVLNAPTFKEHAVAFGVCYGLAVQGLGQGGVRTNLLPREIHQERIIREKKPWAVAAAALVLLACGLSFAGFARTYSAVAPDRWKEAEARATKVTNEAKKLRDAAEEARREFESIDKIGKHLVGNVEGRLLWLEVLKVLNDALPQSEEEAKGTSEANPPPKDAREMADRIHRRKDLYVAGIECDWVEDLAAWFEGVKGWYRPPSQENEDAKAPTETAPPGVASGPSAVFPGGSSLSAGPTETSSPQEEPSGSGWVIKIQGYHYHNLRDFGEKNIAAEFVRNTFIRKLQTGKFRLPSGQGDQWEEVSASEIGLDFPVIIDPKNIYEETLPDPTVEDEEKASKGPEGAGRARGLKLQRFDFQVQVAWKKTPPAARQANREAAKNTHTPR